jgi:hypothetical protein
MVKSTLNILFIIIISGIFSVSCKTRTFVLNISTIDQMAQYEKSVNSIFDTCINFGILKNPDTDLSSMIDAKTYIFQRTQSSSCPNVHVWYHFDYYSNRLLGIRYSWGRYNPTFQEVYFSYFKGEKVTLKKYKSLKKELTRDFGEPTEVRDLSGMINRFAEETWWIRDGYKVQFYLGYNKYNPFGFSAEFEMQITYRIE